MALTFGEFMQMLGGLDNEQRETLRRSIDSVGPIYRDMALGVDNDIHKARTGYNGQEQPPLIDDYRRGWERTLDQSVEEVNEVLAKLTTQERKLVLSRLK